MANLTVRNISEVAYAELQREARQNGRSINAEILQLLSDKAEMNRRRRQAAKVILQLRKMRRKIALRHPHLSDSAELIRKDRDSR